MVRQKISVTLTVAFLDVKLKVYRKSERASTARKKKREGAKGKQVVANTKAAKVKKMANGGVAGYETKAKRPFRGSSIPGTAVARGCGASYERQRKRTKGSVSQA